MEVEGTEPRRKGMKRQRELTSTAVLDHTDADGDRRMSIDAEDLSVCGDGDSREDGDGSDADDRPLRKRAMLIKANLRFLEKLPPVRDYQRSRNGRRGALDSGDITGALMMAALEESFEETSFVTLEPPAREAMVAPVPVARLPAPTFVRPVTREVSRTRDAQWIRSASAVRSVLTSAKDNEARPACE